MGAGASFIVTPAVNEGVIRKCVELGVPVFPGAFSPGEIYRAWELGATMVKVFPADHAGPGYFRMIRGTWPEVKLLPTGGVSLKTLEGYAGLADGFGVGSPLFHPERLARSDWGWVEDRTREFCEAVRVMRCRAV